MNTLFAPHLPPQASQVMTRARPVADEVMRVLHRLDIEDRFVRIPFQLDRSLYAAVSKVLEAAGGVWNRRAKAHLYPGRAQDALDPVLLSGRYETGADYGFFVSPPAVVARVMDAARIEPGHGVLEPSAGTGNLAVAALQRGAELVYCVELQAKLCGPLEARLNDVTGIDPRLRWVVCNRDFMEFEPEPIYDRVVMNPPFAGRQDLAHVMRASRCLKPGGRLAAVMSAGVLFRSDRLAQDFRARVALRRGTIEHLPDNAFASSGTDVRTVLVAFDEP